MYTLPSVGVRRDVIIPSSVDFPAPFTPTMPRRSPASSENETESRITFSPILYERSLTLIEIIVSRPDCRRDTAFRLCLHRRDFPASAGRRRFGDLSARRDCRSAHCLPDRCTADSADIRYSVRHAERGADRALPCTGDRRGTAADCASGIPSVLRILHFARLSRTRGGSVLPHSVLRIAVLTGGGIAGDVGRRAPPRFPERFAFVRVDRRTGCVRPCFCACGAMNRLRIPSGAGRIR